jgi:hypothetical protein
VNTEGYKGKRNQAATAEDVYSKMAEYMAWGYPIELLEEHGKLRKSGLKVCEEQYMYREARPTD